MAQITDFKVGEKVLVVAKTVGSLSQFIKVNSIATVTAVGDTYLGIKGESARHGGQTTQGVFPEHIVKIKSKTIKSNNMNITRQSMKSAVESVANYLMTRDGNITTLYILNELKAQYPNVFWNQYDTGATPGVSNLFHELVAEGKFKSIANNGTYQTYVPSGHKTTSTKVQKLGNAIQVASANQSKTTISKSVPATGSTVKISRKKALELMANNKGHFFTVEFVKQDGTERKLNGQYVKDQKNSALGYVLVKEASKLKAKVKEPIRNVNLQTLKSLKIGGVTYQVR